MARTLSAGDHDVTVLDKSEHAFKRLGEGFNGKTVVGNGINIDSLIAADIENAEAVAVVTNGDNTNIIAAQVVQKIFKIDKVIARVYDPRRAYIYNHLGLDVLSGTTLVAVRMRDKILEKK